MTLTVQIKELEHRQQELHVEVPEQRIKEEMRKSTRKLARDMHIPGFRKGKAPHHVIAKRVGEANLRTEAQDTLTQLILEEAIAQEGIQIYGSPTFNNVEEDPLRFIYTISLPPAVELGDYRALRREIEKVEITEEAIDETVKNVQENSAILTDVMRPVEAGDLVLLDGHGELIIEIDDEENADIDDVDGEDEEDWNKSIIFDEEGSKFVMESNRLFPGTPFVDNIIGLSAGDYCEFTFTFPDDYEDVLAGKKAEFNINVISIQSRTIPELTDEFVRNMEQEYKTVTELRKEISKELYVQAIATIKNNLLSTLGKDLVADATIVYPPNAVEMEIDSMVNELKVEIKKKGWELEDYLRMNRQTEDNVREDVRENAVTRLITNLTLGEFVKQEKLMVSVDDFKAEVNKQLSSFAVNEELRNSLNAFYKQSEGVNMINNQILMGKMAVRYADILTGNALDLDVLDAVETAVSKSEEE